MDFLGVNLDIKNLPELDPEFIPLHKFNEAFLRGAEKPVGIALERAGGEMAAVETRIHGTPEMYAADCYYIDRLVKTMLWMKGGYKIYVRGDARIYDYLRSVYCAGGVREFDWDYMANVFERPFEVVQTDTLPAAKDSPKAIGGHMDGCRIGFDAGGSDRKVSAVINGEAAYSEEVVWFPKINSDPDYHYTGIVTALKSAAEHMPRVDAVGVSSAGIYINNRTMNASLFLKVPKEQFDAKVKDIYIRAITDTFGDVPYSVVNDGDRARGRDEPEGKQHPRYCHGHERSGGLRGRRGAHNRLAQRAGLRPGRRKSRRDARRMERRYRLRREIFFTGRCEQARAQSRD